MIDVACPKRYRPPRPRPAWTKAHQPREPQGHPALSPWERVYRRNMRYGFDLEQKAIVAFCEGEVPPWFLRIRPATREEDMSGVDLWVDTDEGPIAIQIKSSAARAEAFLAAHPGGSIYVVVLHANMTDAKIRGRILQYAAMGYKQRRLSRTGGGSR